MAYSDYGGLSFRGSEVVEDLSDVLYNTKTGEMYASTPGMYPYFAHSDLKDNRDIFAAHVAVIGNRVSAFCRKQWLCEVFYEGRPVLGAGGSMPEDYDNHVHTRRFPNGDVLSWAHVDTGEACYAYVRLVESDGKTHYAFSGYHVGFGFDEVSDGTERATAHMRSFWEEHDE